MENARSAERGKDGVWKIRSVENAECGKCSVKEKYKYLKSLKEKIR